ncbi:MAG: hypothetical protein HY862_13325 [Chloroflexi bacterium]|nr:hypothetical protein [Chloroflexota bacterium]
MGIYTSAASEILDRLWEGYEGFAAYFHERDVSLRDLGHVLEEVFVPAYLHVKSNLDRSALYSLQHEITEDVLGGLMHKPGFRNLWDEWDDHTRQTFLQEPIEEQLGRMLFEGHADQFAQIFIAAYEAYRP